MTELPTVTVLIPARNEEADIRQCLSAVLAQDYPRDLLEVVLVDGGSSDGTTSVAKSTLDDTDIAWRIIDNPAKTTPSNLNVGLGAASGEVLCRVDARSVVPPDYVRLCAQILGSRPEVAVTGGAQVASARDNSAVGAGIARGLNNRYAMGGARYRSAAASGPSDTVYLGAFRTEDVRAAGGWNEYFETNQDFELNRRLATNGIVWFDARIKVRYTPRSGVVEVWKQYHRFGRWKVRYWRVTGDSPLRRQWFLIVAPLLGIGAAAAAYRLRRLTPAAILPAVGVAGLLALDELGSEQSAPMSTRAVSAGVSSVVAGAWWTGLVREWTSGLGR